MATVATSIPAIGNSAKLAELSKQLSAEGELAFGRRGLGQRLLSLELLLLAAVGCNGSSSRSCL
jgi:hypothetical protein